MEQRRQRLRAVLLAVALLSACGSSSHPAAAPACRPLPEPLAPDTAGSLQDGDAGGTFCLRRGDAVGVFLHAPVTEDRWGTVSAAPSGLLEARSSGVMTLPLGVTGAIYAGVKAGTVELRSDRSPDHHWSARLVIQG